MSGGVVQRCAGGTQFVEARERLGKGGLVERLDAAESIAVDRAQRDLSPLGLEALFGGWLERLRPHGPTVVQCVHRDDVIGDLRGHVPRGVDVVHQLARLEADHGAVVDAGPIRCRRRGLLAIERGVGRDDRRPGSCVRCGFACDVAGFELGVGGIDVVGVEEDPRHDLVGFVRLDDGDGFRVEGIGVSVVTGEREQSDREPFASRGEHRRIHTTSADAGERTVVIDVGAPSLQDNRTDDPAAIVCDGVVGDE